MSPWTKQAKMSTKTLKILQINGKKKKRISIFFSYGVSTQHSPNTLKYCSVTDILSEFAWRRPMFCHNRNPIFTIGNFWQINDLVFF